jgi:hypothetical protein
MMASISASVRCPRIRELINPSLTIHNLEDSTAPTCSGTTSRALKPYPHSSQPIFSASMPPLAPQSQHEEAMSVAHDPALLCNFGPETSTPSV